MKKIAFISIILSFVLFSFNSFAITLGDIISPNENGEVRVDENIQKQVVGNSATDLGQIPDITKEITNITSQIQNVSDSLKNVNKQIQGTLNQVTGEVGKVTGEIGKITTQLKDAQKQIAKVTEMIEYAQNMFGKIQAFSQNIDTYIKMAYIAGICFLILLLLPSLLCIKLYFDIRKLSR